MRYVLQKSVEKHFDTKLSHIILIMHFPYYLVASNI